MFRKPTQHLLRAAMMATVVWLAGCASLPHPHDDGALQREAMAGTHDPVPAPLPLKNAIDDSTDTAQRPAQISNGSGQFIHPTALKTPRPAPAGADGVVYNFENQPIQAVVKTILGDQLKLNYAITPGVQGNITFSTAEAVGADQALPILETLLSWTHNALIQRGGTYVVVPEKDAVAGNVLPSLGASAPGGGLQARLYPLHYISATEMQKLIKPFARPDAVLLADPARNVLVMSGTPDELDNYQNMVRTFDVDWLRGMSVGVFNLQYATVGELMPKLDGMFGMHGDTPLAGMLRFIPIERTNALVVISTQPQYLDEVGDWIHRIDSGGGNEPQLFVYDVRNIKASDLAKYLAQIYTNSSSSGSDNGGRVGPGLSSGTLGSGDNANSTSLGSTAGGFGNSSSGTTSGIGGLGGGASAGSSLGSSGSGFSSGSGQSRDGSASSSTGSSTGALGSSSGSNGSTSGASNDQQYSSGDGSVKISSVDSNNQLLVRARPSQWEEIKSAIRKLDTVPLQVQIETRILEVNLTGDFQFGVQWYLQGLTGSTTTTDSNGDPVVTPGQPYRHRQVALGSGGTTYTGEPFFYSFLNSKLQVAVQAMETSGNTKTLSAPSMVVSNNQVASFAVGDQIPINQTSVNTGIGVSSSVSEVSYINTGVILNVQPRINPGGLVYMNVSQEVSQADKSVALVNGNPQISQRKLATQVAVQSGQTVLLGGLISQADGTTDTGIPGLNRVPILGRLFGTTSRSRTRTELIVLITPRVIRNSEDAKRITDEYQTKFESLAPLRAGAAAPVGAIPTALEPPSPVVITPLSSTAPSLPSWPEQLQQHAEASLRQADFSSAQDLAMQSWKQGTHRGSLCERNWQTIIEVRKHSNHLGSVEAARKEQQSCLR